MRRHRTKIALALLLSHVLAGGLSVQFAGADLICVAQVCLGDRADCSTGGDCCPCDVAGVGTSAAVSEGKAADQHGSCGSCCPANADVGGARSALQCCRAIAKAETDHRVCCSVSFTKEHCPCDEQGRSDHGHFPFCPGHCPLCGQGKVVLVVLSDSWRPMPQCVGWVVSDVWFAPVEGASNDLLRPPIA